MKVPFRQYWFLLVDYLKNQKLRFAVLVILLLGSIGLQVLNPQIVRYFIDSATTGANTEALLAAAAVFIGLALLQQVVGVGATYTGESVAWTATNELRADLAHHCLFLDMSFHNDRSPGELIERIDGDVGQLANFFSQFVISILGNLLLLFGVLSVLFLEDWRLGIVFSLFASVTLFALNRVRGIAIPHQKALREATAELFGYLEERLAGTEDIRSSGAVKFVMRGLYKLQYSILNHWRKAWLMFLVVRLIAGMLMTLGTALSLLLSYYLFKDGILTLGTVYLVLHYVNILGRPIRELTRQLEQFQNIGAAVERLEELKGIESKLEDGPGGPVGDGGPIPLTFDEVSFAYVEDEPIFEGLSFSLEPGTVLGLLGRTGSGKTTITRLIFRLYDTTAGRIQLDGIDIRQFQLHELRDRVAMVTQDVQLFQATVRDNLTFFDRSIPDSEIMSVLEALELMDWYEMLPEGLDTKLETGGRGLSAGEAQLLAFTRVFLKDPGLVILDEASSRLDPLTEQRIERAIDKLLENRTAIIVAHRLGTVQRADQIMILEDGQVIEHGNRVQLMADPNSRFTRLLKTNLAEVLV